MVRYAHLSSNAHLIVLTRQSSFHCQNRKRKVSTSLHYILQYVTFAETLGLQEDSLAYNAKIAEGVVFIVLDAVEGADKATCRSQRYQRSK